MDPTAQSVHDSQYSNLEALGPPTYSNLELAPSSPRFSPLPELRTDEHGTATYDGKEASAAKSNAYVEPGSAGDAAKGRRICGLSLRWCIVIAVIAVLAIAGGVAGGVVASKSSSSKSAQNDDAATTPPIVAAKTVTLIASPSASASNVISSSPTTSPTASPTPSVAAPLRPFTADRWYYIQNFELGIDLQVLRRNASSPFWDNALALDPNTNLGKDTQQYWQLLPVPASDPDSSTQHPDKDNVRVGTYFINNRATGPGQRLMANALPSLVERGVEMQMLFVNATVGDRQQYWYVTKADSADKYWEIRNLFLGDTYLVTGHPKWNTPQMCKKVRAVPPIQAPSGSWQFAIKEVGEMIDRSETVDGETWVVDGTSS